VPARWGMQLRGPGMRDAREAPPRPRRQSSVGHPPEILEIAAVGKRRPSHGA
jgi:hypothetical protein